MSLRFIVAGQSSSRRFCLILARTAVAASLLLFLISSSFSGCNIQVQERTVVRPAERRLLDKGSPFLKAHMRDGSVYVLSQWTVDDTSMAVTGVGRRLGINRAVTDSGAFTLAIDSVAIFETNRVQPSGAIAGMTILTGLSIAVAIACIANPKACFGSCPTFYASDGEHMVLQAEGFSAAVAPSLEKHDIDALYRARHDGPGFDLLMKNEAYETHVVRYANLLAARRPPHGRVFVTSEGSFFTGTQCTLPVKAVAAEGECTDALIAFDGIERFSPADSLDLATRETIDLQFASVPEGNLGLVVAARQSLLSTYLFYQTLAYMGASAAENIAQLERGGDFLRTHAQVIGQLLGGIEVQVPDSSGQWVTTGQVGETGPLAADTRVVPLKCTHGDSLNIRLRLTRGHWRLDYVALFQLGENIEPLCLKPIRVARIGAINDRALGLLNDSLSALITFPGDEYTISYRLPGDYADCELFLDSRGYYLEWMRDEWLAEENPARAAEIFLNPQRALQTFAPEFKKVEPQIEELFWNSRYAHH